MRSTFSGAARARSQPRLHSLYRPLLLAALIATMSACGGGGGGDSEGTGGGAGSSSALTSYAGEYDLRTNEGTVLRVTLDGNGRVTSCGAAYTCEGALTLTAGGQGGVLRVTGSDGQSAGSTRVSLEANFDAQGRITGTWNAESGGERDSGTLTGEKVPGSGSPTNPSTPTTPTTPTNPTTPTTPTNPTTPTAPSTSLASYAGKYNLRADEGTVLQFTAGADGAIKSCVGASIYVCSGSLQLKSDGQGASFSVSGNDGEKPVDTSVTLTGNVDQLGNVTGSYKGNSTSDGPFSGSFTGTKEGGVSTVTPGTATGCAAVAGTWYHSEGGTWTFSGSSGKLLLNSLNYGARAQQITELALSSCASSVMQYKIVRAALINTVDPTFAYDKTPGDAGVDWSKVYNQPYTLNGIRLTIGNYTYTKQ